MSSNILKSYLLFGGISAIYWGIILGLPLLSAMIGKRALPHWSAGLTQVSVFIAGVTALLNGPFIVAILFPPLFALVGGWNLFTFLAISPKLMLVILGFCVGGFALSAYLLDKWWGRWAFLPALFIGFGVGVIGGNWYAQNAMRGEAETLGGICLHSQSLLQSVREKDVFAGHHPHASMMIDDKPYGWSYKSMTFLSMPQGSFGYDAAKWNSRHVSQACHDRYAS